MFFIRGTLLKGEKLLYWTRPHWIIFAPGVGYMIGIALVYIYGQRTTILRYTAYSVPLYEWLSLIVAIIAVMYLTSAYIAYRTSEYGVTDKRVLMKTGWIRRNSIEIFMEKIEAIYVRQSIPGRVLKYGSLIIVGTGGSEDPITTIPDPLGFRKKVQQQIDIIEQRHQLSEHS